MKRLITFLSLIAILALSIYTFIIKVIIAGGISFEIMDYVMIGLIILLTLLVGIFFVLFLYRNKDKKISWLKKRLEQWNHLSVHVNKAGDEVFSLLPVGIIIYDENYDFKWVNTYAKKIFDDELLERQIVDFSESLQKNIKEEKANFMIELNDEYFDCIHKVDNHLVYLFDVTKRENINTRYNNRIPVLGIITLDNLEMEMKSFDLQETARIRGLYLGEISDWTAKYNGYLKSYDDDSLMFILDNESFRNMMAGKFEILEKVREISKNNGIRVTLSIGIACWDVNYEELGTYAQNAIDLAEKRGGDQVVVNIQGEKIQYFGAKTNALEKNNLLAARTQTLALRDVIDASSNVYIMGHMDADADAIGAMIGAYKLAASGSKKPTKIAIDYNRIDVTAKKMYDEIKKQDKELFEAFSPLSNTSEINPDSLLLIVDTQSPKIIMSQEFMNRFKRIAVIDHHRTDDAGFVDTVFSYIEPYASSTVELVTEMFLFYQKEKFELTAFEATMMLAGVVVDTNNFTFRCGTRTFEAASTLKEYGADMIEIRRLLRNDVNLQLSLAKYVQNSEILLEHFAICVVEDQKPIEDKTMLAKIAEHLLNIENIEATFVIARYKDVKNPTVEKVAVSARSYKDVNVQVIMEEMGGGGHLNSAATQIKDKTVLEVKKELVTILQRDFEIGDEFMKVILTEDVNGRGAKNDVINVAVGYGNYLVSNKKAIIATDENLAKLKESLAQAELEAENQKKLMQKIKEDIEEKCVNIYIKVGADGKLFGHVTTKQICEEFEAQSGIRLDKRKVSLPVDITTFGVYTAVVDLHKDVQANLEINVLEK